AELLVSLAFLLAETAATHAPRQADATLAQPSPDPPPKPTPARGMRRHHSDAEEDERSAGDDGDDAEEDAHDDEGAACHDEAHLAAARSSCAFRHRDDRGRLHQG